MELFKCVSCDSACKNDPLCDSCKKTMTKQHDYAAALEWANHEFRGRTVHDGHPILAIFHALKVADRLMQEPSEEMLEKHEVALIECHPAEKGAYLCNAGDVFKAMRDQLLAEVGE